MWTAGIHSYSCCLSPTATTTSLNTSHLLSCNTGMIKVFQILNSNNYIYKYIASHDPC